MRSIESMRERMYENIFRYLPDAAAVIMCSTDSAGKAANAHFVAVNDAFRALFPGAGEEEREPWEGFLDPVAAGSDVWLDSVADTIRSGGAMKRDIYTGRPFNLWLDARFFPISGGLVAVMLSDITRKKRIELALERQRTNLVVF